MAGYALIDGYLDSLRASLRWRRDLDDLVAEMEDHLYSAVERLEDGDGEARPTQERVLAGFGDSQEVATAFASTPKGGLMLPTEFTRSSGIAALVSAAAWFFALVVLQLAALFPDRASSVAPDQFVLDGQTAAILVAVVALLAAGALMVVAMVGLYQRHGGLGVLGMGGIVVTALGAAALVFFWAFGLWLSLMAVGTLLFAIAMFRCEIAPRLWTVVFGAGLGVGAVVWHAVRWLEVGEVDEWGNYAIGDVYGVALGVVIMAVGLIGLGTWLRGEEPVTIEPAKPLTAA